jgi:hypothetical protein
MSGNVNVGALDAIAVVTVQTEMRKRHEAHGAEQGVALPVPS